MAAVPESPSVPSRLAVPLIVGGAVAVALGVYGRVHDATHHALFTLIFTDTVHMKVWLATVAVALACVQILTALRLYGRIHIPRNPPAWLGDFHRLTGTLVFVVSLPVAFHCLWSLGLQSNLHQTRTYVHSVLGCLFYGAFAAKVIAVRSRRMASWTLPVVGGIAFTTLVGLWLSSSLWFFNHVGFGL
jgi:hypothetical protein